MPGSGAFLPELWVLEKSLSKSSLLGLDVSHARTVDSADLIEAAIIRQSSENPSRGDTISKNKEFSEQTNETSYFSILCAKKLAARALSVDTQSFQHCTALHSTLTCKHDAALRTASETTCHDWMS